MHVLKITVLPNLKKVRAISYWNDKDWYYPLFCLFLGFSSPPKPILSTINLFARPLGIICTSWYNCRARKSVYKLITFWAEHQEPYANTCFPIFFSRSILGKYYIFTEWHLLFVVYDFIVLEFSISNSSRNVIKFW